MRFREANKFSSDIAERTISDLVSDIVISAQNTLPELTVQKERTLHGLRLDIKQVIGVR